MHQSIIESHLHSDVNVVLPITEIKESMDQEWPLNDESSQQQVQADSSEAITSKESHQEAETDEDHDMDILEHCEKDSSG